MSKAQEMLDLLAKWVARSHFDDCSNEAIDDNFRMQSENVFINGKWIKIRRIFVSVRGAKSYERVGWVVNEDVKQCMICCSQFFEDKHHCAGCGNIVCDRCSPEEGVIFELSAAGPLRVCIQCYYGQDPVYAIIHEDVVLAPFIVKRNNSYKQLASSPSAITPAKSSDGQFVSSPVDIETTPPPPVESPIPSGHYVDPIPKLVLKTRLAGNDRKIFINICGHEDVPAGRAVAAELAKEGTENSGQQCLIFDVTFFLGDVESAMNDADGPSEALHKICVQAMFTVKKLFKQSLRDEYTLPKIRNNYKGEMVQRAYVPANLTPVFASPQLAKSKIDELKTKQEVLDKQLIAALKTEESVEYDDDGHRESLAGLAEMTEEEERLANEVLLMKEALKEAEEEEKERSLAEAAASAAAAAAAEADRVQQEKDLSLIEIRAAVQAAEDESKRRAALSDGTADGASTDAEHKKKGDHKPMPKPAASAAAAAPNSDDDDAEPEEQRDSDAATDDTAVARQAKIDQDSAAALAIAREKEEAAARAAAEAAEKARAEEDRQRAEESKREEERKREAARLLAALPKDKRVIATPATVIKTKEATGEGRKVFVNVLVHQDVADGKYGFCDALKEVDGIMIYDVCCNEAMHDQKMSEMDDDPEIMLEVYADLIDALSAHFKHPLQSSDLKFPKTRNNYKAGISGEIDPITIPITQKAGGIQSNGHSNGAPGVVESKKPVNAETVGPSIPPRKAGWLTKEGHSLMSSWKKRYFVLQDGTFGYYGDESLSKQYGNIALSNAGVELVDAKGSKRLVISTASGVQYKMEYREDPDAMILRDWMEALERHIAYATTMSLLSNDAERTQSTADRPSFLKRMASRGSVSRTSRDSFDA